MFNSVALNVVVSLVFIYLLYSLLASIFQELISTMFGLRARMLAKGIGRMLDDDSGTTVLSKLFYKHPLIKYLGQNGLHKRPSYMAAQNFSKVMIDLLRGKDVQPGQNFAPEIQKALDAASTQWEATDINADTILYLKSIWADSQGDVEKFRASLEQWFDDTMERASGWYKKRIQLILFIMGFGLAVVFNIDTISIVEKLSRNPKLAEQMADNASEYIRTHQSLATQMQRPDMDSTEKANLASLDSNLISKAEGLVDSADVMIKGEIADANKLLGLGWSCSRPEHKDKSVCFCDNFHGWTFFGWLITALAISLGAPFWFDLLNKLVKLRGAAKSTEDNNTAADGSAKGTVQIKPKG